MPGDAGQGAAIASFTQGTSEFLKASGLTKSRAFIQSFVREIKVRPRKATIQQTTPMPENSPIGGADAADVALNGWVTTSV